MTVTVTGMPAAMQGLQQALAASRRPGAPLGNWRWVVRQRMAGLRDALVTEAGTGVNGWTAAREGTVLRERNALLARMSSLGPQVLESADVDGVRVELDRLLADVARHVQRVNDLAYDDVELELGGSE
ncbi:hypothetical protein ABLE68_07605 [Nocardioides sp. CN2-186]|uniref:hypothetical protein n=1 Tax=Nocardioides tweenelious TaxID=3156607 RepID=UPI0032B5DF50